MAALWLVALCNGPLWTRVAQAVAADQARDYLFLGACFVSLVLFFNALLALLTLVRPLAKPLLIGVMLIAGTAAAFTQQYGVLLDRVMIQNVFETDPAEVRDLLSAHLLLLWAALGLLPALLIAWAPLRVRSLKAGLLEGSVNAAGSLAAVAVVVLAFGADYASLLRNHRELRFMLTPTNALWYTGSYLSRRNAVPQALEVVGADARQHADGPPDRKPRLLVLMVGETARAQDFSLGGRHARETNPLLKLAGGSYFSQVSSCGTSTAVSLPCMFSDLGREGYSDAKAKRRENLLDVVQRVGLDVLWLNNNSGCKGVCARVPVETFDERGHPGLCEGAECFDEVLVRDLEEHLASLKRDTLIVLHQKGSHGPAYYRRYPPAFERYTPTCASSRLPDCAGESLHNTYDNTILYTDFVVASTIETLKRYAATIDSAALYVSDHGESLGERGLFLHGAPYLVAPDVQVKIPLYAWFSAGYRERTQLNPDCVSGKTDQPFSHDNLFHTTLAMLGVDTAAYRPTLDMLAGCRMAANPSEETARRPRA
ncbi:MAG: phosphoethanolamine--lipid A transferase [Polycyclovorans sp.]|nr:phosphoethanolamine--lipid A transferase [Polycyclovorans sp.]